MVCSFFRLDPLVSYPDLQIYEREMSLELEPCSLIVGDYLSPSLLNTVIHQDMTISNF